jgi:outer membrane protein assembly factor BamA
MKRTIIFLSVIFLTGFFPSSGFSVTSPEESAEKEEEEAIREKRHFKSKGLSERFLEIPKYILEVPWYPLKHALNFSERHDLVNRAIDVFYFDEERTFGWFPRFSSSNAEVKGVGGSIFHHNLFDREQQANLSFTYGEGNQVVTEAAYTIPVFGGNPYFFKSSLRFMRDDEGEFFARPDPADPLGKPILGMDTNKDDFKNYFIRRFGGRVTAGRQMAPTLNLSTHIRGFTARTNSTLGPFPPPPPGSEGLDEEIDMLGGGMGLEWDRRDDSLRPFKGSFIEAEVEGLVSPGSNDAGNRFGYVQYSLNGQHYIPVYRPHRTLVFLHTLRRVDPMGSRGIPFYELPVLDYEHLLRSYDLNRFQNRGVMTFNLEYRYPIWATWDAFIFGDAGQAFEKYSTLTLPAFRYSAGGGVRFMSKDSLLFVFQVATGREGIRTIFSLGQVF